LPTVTTTAVSAITYFTASGGGNVTADGNATVTARGICWDTLPNPDLTDKYTTNGAGLGTFTSAITNISSATTYYVRAYATNSEGTAYGNEVVFSSETPVIYASGIGRGNGIGYFAQTWKNGVPTALTTGSPTSYDRASSIFVSGNDVYVAGSEANFGAGGAAKVWKNGVATVLVNNPCGIDCNSVFVSGTDVYVAGRGGSCTFAGKPKVWKNGTSMPLQVGIDGGEVKSVFVSGTDVHAVGFDGSLLPVTQKATYWKNGVALPLQINGANSEINSLFIK
jgi:hypothetical protein